MPDNWTTQEPDISDKIRQAITHIQKSDSFLIISCANPDGDSIASQLILADFIRQIKQRQPYRLDIINEHACPNLYSFLQNISLITPLAQAHPQSAYQVGIMTDGGPERAGQAYSLWQRCACKIVVDHHLIASCKECHIPLVSATASSTCEVLYRFLQIANSPLRLHRSLAEMFYTGIIFDTGGFQYNLTASSTHAIAAELLATGIHFADICERVLLEYTLTARRLQGKVLCSFRTSKDRAIAWAKINRALLERLHAQTSDIDGIVNMINFTEGVKVAILFYEVANDTWKISLRARGDCNVAQLARTLTPEGGGHERAAGCTLQGSYRQVYRRVLSLASLALASPAANRTQHADRNP